MITQENVLSEQEIREADSLCLAWEQVNTMAKSLTGLSPEAEEILAVCYNHITDKTSVVNGNLKGVALATDQIAKESRKWNNNPLVQDYHKTKLPGNTPPVWYQRGLSALENQFDQIALRIKGGFPLINLLTNSMTVVPPQQITEALRFFQDNSQKLDGLENNLRDTMREMRALMVKKTGEFSQVRSAIFDTLCLWAGASSARVEYLRSKGIAVAKLGIQCTDARSTNPEPAQSLRRQKKRKVTETAVVPKTSVEAELEKPWQVICVNGLGNQLCSFPLMLSGNGENLAKELHQYFKWMNVVRNAQQRTMEKLRNLLNATPAQRNNSYGTYAFAEEMFYRLRIGKGRIMVRPDDQARTIKILAGHKTEAMKEIGQRHNEA